MAANALIQARLDPKLEKKLRKLERGLERAMIQTMNQTGLLAGLAQKKQLRRDFTLRTKFTEGSIRPAKRAGKNSLGLIPEHKKNLRSAYIRTGTVQDYLRKQEEGWTARDPYVPTNKARVGRSFKRKIKKKASMLYLKSRGAITPGRLKGVSEQNQVKAFIAILRKTRFKGLIRIEKKNHVLPQGYYKMRNRKTLDLLRYHQEGSRRRKQENWHQKAMRDPMIFRDQQKWFNRKARVILTKAGIK